MQPWSRTQAWQVDQLAVEQDEQSKLDDPAWPHIRLTETVWLPKPYRTVIAAGNPMTGESWDGHFGP
jgi:hypothetical protein